CGPWARAVTWRRSCQVWIAVSRNCADELSLASMCHMTSPVPTYTIDDVTLRDVPDDVVAARARVAGLRAQGAAGDAERIGRLQMLGDLDVAERLGWRSLAAAGGPGTAGDVPVAGADVDLPIEAVGAALRLAHVLQWQRRSSLPMHCSAPGGSAQMPRRAAQRRAPGTIEWPW